MVSVKVQPWAACRDGIVTMLSRYLAAAQYLLSASGKHEFGGEGKFMKGTGHEGTPASEQRDVRAVWSRRLGREVVRTLSTAASAGPSVSR
jgi:hypothetical protein